MNIRGHYMDIRVKYKKRLAFFLTYNARIMPTNVHEFFMAYSYQWASLNQKADVCPSSAGK